MDKNKNLDFSELISEFDELLFLMKAIHDGLIELPLHLEQQLGAMLLGSLSDLDVEDKSMKDLVSSISSNIRNLMETGIKVEMNILDCIILPPDNLDVDFSSEDPETSEVVPGDFERTNTLLSALEENGVELGEMKLYQGVESSSLARKSGYVCIDLYQRGIKVFVNDSYSQATFIVFSEDAVEDLSKLTKSEIADAHRVIKVVFDQVLDEWAAKVIEVILGRNDVLLPDGMSEEEFFHDSECTRKYLECLLIEFGLDSVFDLSTSKRGRNINLPSGETVTYYTLLRRLKKYYEYNSLPLALNKLLETAGYMIMNKVYFRDMDIVRSDFETIAGIQGVVDWREIAVSRYEEFTAYNGEVLTTSNFFARAAYYRGFASNARLGKGYKSDVKEELLKEMGIEPYMEMDEAYFCDQENVSDALWRFTKAFRLDHPNDLRTYNEVSVEFDGGEVIGWFAFLSRAGTKLKVGFEDGLIKKGAILKKLLEIAELN